MVHFRCVWCLFRVGSVGMVSGVSFGLVSGLFGINLGFAWGWLKVC